MNFKTFNNLNDTITQNLYKIPRDIDIVAGIPRSGLFPANLIALYLNKPLADLDGLLEQRLLAVGNRLDNSANFPHNPKILLVDDSIQSGQAIKQAVSKIESSNLHATWLTCVVYATSNTTNLVDIHLDVCQQPRMFQWNWCHHANLSKCCLDIDGVLCADPTHDQNDDGDKYIDFLADATPLNIPTQPIGALVTNRLEKYRKETEAWLTKHHIVYDQLIMLDLPDAATRQKLNAHAKFKADFYSKSNYTLFIESCNSQSLEISKIAGKSIYCVDSNIYYPASQIEQLRNQMKYQGYIYAANLQYRFSLLKNRIIHKVHKYMGAKNKNAA
ncbi:phosphoribosyltransferase [Planctomycetota bacterium]|nr:phosphoribosyltransferase [Planctomycetota bacterium]